MQRPPSLPLFALLLLPLAASCTGGGGDVGSDSSAQLADRRFGIVVPQSLAADLTLDAGPLMVQGEVIDLDGEGLPDELDWRVQQGGTTRTGSVDIAGDGAFSASLQLEPGDNQVRLFIAGTEAELEFTATLNPGYSFAGQLQVSPDVVYLNEPRMLTAAVALLDPETDPAMVELVRVDGSTETVVASLTDDGDLGNGDEIEGDGIFTGQFLLTEAAAGTVDLRVRVQLLTTAAEARSEVFEVLSTEHLSDADLQTILDLHATLEDRLDQAAAAGTLAAEVDAVVAELEATDGVAQAGESDSGRGVYVVYENGIGGVLYAAVGDQRSAPQRRLDGRGSLRPSGPGRAVEHAPYEHFFKPHARPVHQPGATELVQDGLTLPAEADEGNKVGSARAIGIGAQFWDWGSTEADQAMTILSQQACFETTLVQYASDGSGSVEDFKNLGSYGVIVIATHGDSYYNGILSLWSDQFGWNIPFTGIVVVHSNMAVTPANKVTYEDDLKKGRLVLWHGSYGITPSFVERYSGTLPNSLVWMGICRGAFNGTMAGAFLARGAGAYLSFDEYVSVSWPIQLGVQTMQTLVMDDMTLSDAFTPGQLDPNYTGGNPFGAAEWKLYGADDLSIDLEGIQDGSFESNSIGQAWTVAGDGRIVPSLGAATPTDGAYMGIVSTGLGFTTDSGTISQRFCMPADAGSISLDWNFFSEEFLEYVGSIFQDAFVVTLTEVDDPSNQIEIVNEYVDSLADQVTPVANSFDQGDVYATGWRTTTVAIPESLRGKRVELSFYATDVGDSIYDTAVLIDRVEIAPAAP